MKKILHLALIIISFTVLSCKKDKTDPNTNDTDAYATLQGKWQAMQQSATVNGQANGQTESFEGQEYIYEFSGSELKSYDAKNQASSTRRYNWKILNGELILREQYSDRGQVYQLSFDGNNTFSLIDSYQSIQDQITITTRFSRR